MRAACERRCECAQVSALSRVLSLFALLAINGELVNRLQVRRLHLAIALEIADYLNFFGLLSQLKILHQLSLNRWGSKTQPYNIFKVKITNTMIKAIFS